MNNNNNNSGGIGFLGLLAIVFIALKLIGVIKWSWIWILSPIWMPIIIGGVLIVIGAIIMRL